MIGENVIQIKSGKTIKVNTDVKTTWYKWKRLYLEACYMQLWEWKTFSKHYWRFSKYVGLNYRSNKNNSNKV